MVARHTYKNVTLLAVCQALFMTTTSLTVTVGALAGFMLATDKSLATLPFAVMFISTSVTTLPASLFMKRVGRRNGFLTGAASGVLGGAIAAYAIAAGDLWLFSLGMVFVGIFNGFAFYFRFAAADVADQAFRPKAISLVMAGGVVAAFTGPNLARLTTHLWEPYLYAGSFAAIILVYLLVVLVLLFIDIPKPSEAERRGRGRPMTQIARQPAFITAVIGATVAHSVMMLVMTVTPLAMERAGCTLGQTSVVIQGHILGMYVPAFFTGHLIARYGVLNVMLWGAVLLFLCIGVNLSGQTVPHFTAALILLGVGWNFLFTGATTLLVETHRPEEKAKTQGVNDVCVYGTVTVAVLSSGWLQTGFGWEAVNMGVIPLAAVATIAVLALLLVRRRDKAAQNPT